jgi:hypothetical protein
MYLSAFLWKPGSVGFFKVMVIRGLASLETFVTSQAVMKSRTRFQLITVLTSLSFLSGVLSVSCSPVVNNGELVTSQDCERHSPEDSVKAELVNHKPNKVTVES